MPHRATQKQITTELSTRQVTLSANQPIGVFDVIVYNDSDRFASFQVKLLAAGATTEGKPWYRLTPSVSAKIPIGDCTRFQIEIFDLPPISQQFRGAIDLTVEVTSRELVNQYDRPSLRLLADGLQGQPPTISLLLPALEAHPGDRVAIVAQVATAAPLEVILRLQGLPEVWFAEGTQQHLSLLPGKPQKVTFDCQVPPPLEAPSQPYALRLEATGRFPSVTATGQLQILPAGSLTFRCQPEEAAIPERLGTWINPSQGTAKFLLEFDNLSNLEPGVQIAVQEVLPRRWWRKTANSVAAPEGVVPNATVLPVGVTIAPLPATLPTGITALPMQIQRRLPWLGWTRSRQFQVTAQLIDSAVPLQPEAQTLTLYLFPVIPRWLQLLGALLALGLGALVWTLLSDPGHRAAVNSVQFSGQGTEVLSGSDDQTIRRWQIQTDSLHTKTRIGNLNKAVRVVRYRPVNNDQIALGFENGEIQLANLLTGQRSQLTPDKDDRVFDLVFSRDARTLFSAHGSGLVLQWDISHFEPEQTQPVRAYDAKFTIQSMALVGDDDRLAIGGRYNRLLLLDTKPAKFAEINVAYPSGGASDYISSLSRAEQQSNLLAVGDTKGQLSVWDMQDCQKNRGRCQPIDSWLGQGGSPVRSVALSTDGCFLASAGDDGLVRLWPLDGQGRRSATEGRILGRSPKPLNAVDIIATRDAVWVTSGGSDAKVRLYPVRLAEQLNDRCPVLGGG